MTKRDRLPTSPVVNTQSEQQKPEQVGQHPGPKGGDEEAGAAEESTTRVLVVDDDRLVREVLADFLGMEGFAVTTAEDGEQGVAALEQQKFDVVISDLRMPRKGGLGLLKDIAQLCPDAVTVVMTGFGTVEDAVDVMSQGAHYLLKPFKIDEVIALVRQGLAKRREQANGGPRPVGIDAEKGMRASFRRALDSLWMAYQPIVHASTGEIYGHEALLRTREETMPGPQEVLEAAESLGALDDLGRAIREKAVRPFLDAQDSSLLFLNLHPADLNDPALFSLAAPLAKMADRVVLEITERSSLEKMSDLRERIADLRRMGFRIAVDDLGAGYSGLTTFAQLEPEVVKLDMSLVRGVHMDETKKKVVRSMTTLARDMGALVVAEGVELEEERQTVISLGCELLQGFLLARPQAM